MGYRNRKLKVKTQRTRAKLGAGQGQKSKVSLLAPAKINIGLLVKEKLPSGYHNIETLMVPIKLFDKITITKKEKEIFFKTNAKELPIDNNLVVKAARLFFEATKINSGINIYLKKNIPIGAGLGGGSSDAASTLLGLNQLFGYPLSFKKLCKLAVNIGMDVPFFLYKSACHAKGRGEILTSFKTPKVYMVLYTPKYGISTKWAYQNVDKRKGAGLTDNDFSLMILRKRLVNNDLQGINALIVNNFESLVFSKYPDLLEIKNNFLSAGTFAASLSGSGSSLFGLVKQNMIKTLKNYLRKANIKVVFTETI
jgi:4-diphosphocytidyl-2-C-methyl-D-erythritol kinase